MVANPLEEDAASQERELESLYINPYSVLVPCKCSDAVRDQSREQAIEVEEEEQRETGGGNKFNEPCPYSSCQYADWPSGGISHVHTS